MNDNNSNYSGGIGFFGLLTLIFVIAKITGYITWSWWWVFSPILFGFVFLVLLFLFFLIILAVINK